MASIEKRNRNGRSRWYVRYRDPAGRQRVKVFDRKIDAERYLTTTESAKLSGSYVDPRRAAVTVGEFARKWKGAQAHLKPSTRERYAGLLREHVEPRWGRVPLSEVAHSSTGVGERCRGVPRPQRSRLSCRSCLPSAGREPG